MDRRTLLRQLLIAGSLPFWAPVRMRAEARSGTGSDIEPLHKSKAEWRLLLAPAAYAVLFEAATEPAFSSPLDSEKRDGTYLCAACLLPLFASRNKYDSGTGWPSFTRPIGRRTATRRDYSQNMRRTEYHCVRCGGHQGHVFDDGPRPTGKRWCNNGLALHFVPRDDPLPPLRN